MRAAQDRGRRSAVLFAAALSAGCYTGVSFDGADPDGGGTDSAGSGNPSGESGDGDETGDPADPEGLCEGEIGTGVTALRRLTRTQYDNTIRDLLGLEAGAESRFDADERIGPFANNSIIPVTERLVEQYMSAAEDLAAEADLASILPCDPAQGDSACATEFIETFGRRAFRRPLTADEVTLFEGVYAAGAEDGGFDSGIRLALEGLLAAPQTLYLLEFGGDEVEAGGPLRELDGYELASRLSYFLWASTPDETLLDAAEDLGDPEVLEAEARRLLDDPKARAAIAGFHSQWVGMHNIDDMFKDPELFPAFDEDVRAAMKKEAAQFAEHVIFEGDGRLETLLTAPYTVVDEALLATYGVDPGDYTPGEKLDLDPEQRGGLLTQPGFLAVHAHHNQTSPVHRGVALRRNFLCDELQAPPPDVDNTPPPLDPDATTRERFEQHQSDPTCAACHVLIDNLGLALEHYDAVGAWRTMDGAGQVDASGELVGAGDDNQTFYGALELGAILAKSDKGRHCVTEQWFRFALGRTIADDDACAEVQMYTAFEDSDFDVRELLIATVMSPSFRYLRLELEGE